MSHDTTRCKAAMLLVGNELLSGKIRDENGAYAARTLRARGISLRELRIVGDDVGRIAEAIRALTGMWDVVISSGGVGPTHDDLTMRGVAAAFDVPLVENERLARSIQRIFAHDETELRVWMRMAQLPEGMELVRTEGSRWPIYRQANLWVLPGVPEIFRLQFDVVAASLGGRAGGIRVVDITLGEGHLAELMEAMLLAFPGIEIGSYPNLSSPEYRTRVTLEGADIDLDEAASWMRDRLPDGTVVRVMDAVPSPAPDS